MFSKYWARRKKICLIIEAVSYGEPMGAGKIEAVKG